MMKIQLTWQVILDLDEIKKRLTDNPVMAIKDCFSQSLYIRKIADDSSCFGCNKDSNEP